MFSVVFLLLVLIYYSEADIQISESAMIVSRVKSLKCNSDVVNLPRYPGRMLAYHQWNQVYPGESDIHFISNLGAVEVLNTQYTVELQKFDNNTNIYSLFNVYYYASDGLHRVLNLTIHCSGAERKWISLVDDDFYRYQVDHTMTYAYSESVKFSCLQYLHLSANLLEIQVGWINTAGDRIFTYNQTDILMKLADVHNGSMLCCLYYTTSDYKNGKHIQRFVKDKTLLIYQKDTPNNGDQPSGTSTESNRNITETSTTTRVITDTSNAGKHLNTKNEKSEITSNTNEMGKNTGTTNGTDKNSDITNNTVTTSSTGNETSKYSGTTNETGQKSNADTTDYVVIIISSVSAILLLLLIGICTVKKRCCEKTNRSQRAQLPLPQIPGARLRPSNEPVSTTPFYLNLLFRRECEQEIQDQEEPHYEEVMYQ